MATLMWETITELVENRENAPTYDPNYFYPTKNRQCLFRSLVPVTLSSDRFFSTNFRIPLMLISETSGATLRSFRLFNFVTLRNIRVQSCPADVSTSTPRETEDQSGEQKFYEGHKETLWWFLVAKIPLKVGRNAN